MLKKSFSKVTLAIMLAGSMVGVAEAKELRLGPGVPPAHPAHTPLYTLFAEKLDELSDGRLTGRIMGPEVASLGNMRAAISSQLIEVGLFLPAYFPADVPDINLVADLSFLGRYPDVMSAAMTEYVVTCADCQQELRKLNVVYTGTQATDVYNILSTKPLRTREDLNGARLRVGGPQFSRWAEDFGVVSANIPVNDTFESLSQGVIDGSIGSTADLVSFRLDGVVKYVTSIPLGTFHSTLGHAVGVSTWRQLSVEDRQVVATAASISDAAATHRWGYEMTAEAKDLADQAGIEYIEPSDELLKATAEFAEKDIQLAVDIAENNYGVKQAAEKVDRFRQLIDKWTKIAEKNGHDPAAMAESVQQEVWSKVDFNTYGV